MTSPARPVPWGLSLFAFIGGAITTLAFPTTRVPGLSVLGPAVGLWTFARAGNWRVGALCGLAWGLGFSALMFRWTLELHPAAYVALGLVQALYWLVTGAVSGELVGRLSRTRWVIAVSATWTLVETLRSRWPLGGFEWGQLGLATADLPVRQGAAIVGTIGLTALSVGLAAGLVAWVHRPRDQRAWVPLLTVIVLMLCVVMLGRVGWTTPAGELDVAVVQVDDPCPGEFAADCPDVRDRLLRRFIDGTALLSGDQTLTLWGESILDGPTLAAAGNELVATTGKLAAPLLTGVDTTAPLGRFYRWNALYTSDGELLDAYAKRQPVPFGEYVPFRGLLGGIGDVGRLVPRDMVAGDPPRLLTLPTDDGPVGIGTVVSWEVTFSRLVRDSSVDSNVLATLTTQASYGTSPVSDQLLGAAQLRAAELGKSMIVSATTGRSALIAPDGRRLATTGLFKAGILEGTVPLREGSTPFARWGEWPVLTLAVASLLAAVSWPGYARSQPAAKASDAPVI